MRFPRGRHNGLEIVGFQVKFRFHLRFWALTAAWNFGEPHFHVGPFHWNLALEFDHALGRRRRNARP